MEIKKVAIQGILGSFHHEATSRFFNEEFALVSCVNFHDIPECLHTNTAHFAVMAIENSIAGSIIPNYAIIDNNRLKIVGEVFINIQQNLMALPNQQIADLKMVYSHPMALLQTREYFKKYPHIELVEYTDTAQAAKRIKNENLKGVGAVASLVSADIYELTVLEQSIQTIKNNATRFFVLQNDVNPKYEVAHINKASLKFITKHQVGSLSSALKIFADRKVNLSKIQSMPIIETPFEYAFFVDVVFDSYEQYKLALIELEAHVSHLKILGEYQQNN
ncbi:MAG: prephenate dehydratase [Flavobacteriales bacterium]|jgi:prephenate dehydratase|nr:prephenate dehydratase [Flavobacteriales bacterium]